MRQNWMVNEHVAQRFTSINILNMKIYGIKIRFFSLVECISDRIFTALNINKTDSNRRMMYQNGEKNLAFLVALGLSFYLLNINLFLPEFHAPYINTAVCH